MSKDTPTTQDKYSFSVLEMGPHEYPKFEEQRGKEWIQYGTNDEYPQYLHELYSTSAIHGAIVNTVSEMIAGAGYEGEVSDFWLRVHDLFPHSLVRDLAFDLKLSGNAYICLIWNKARTRVVEAHCMPYHTVRACIKDNGEITAYLYAEEWNKKTEGEKIPAWNPDDKVSPKQVYHIRRPDTQSQYYGTPDYLGGTAAIEFDKELDQYHLNTIKNGLFPGLMFNFNNGEPDEQQRRDIERDIEKKFGGSQGAGKFMLWFNESPDDAATVTAVETSANHELFAQFDERTRDKILNAHGVTSPLLFGVRGSTGFGSNAEELQTAYRLFYFNRIKPMQNLLIEAISEVSGQGITAGDLDIKPNVPEGLMLEKATNWLIEQGEEPGEGWEELLSHKVDYDFDDDLNVELEGAMHFARTVRSNPGKGSDQDTSLFKIRYRYKSTGGATHSSREFCTRMMRANKIYRKEDIVKAGDQAVNPGWGPGGANTYDVWLYKGGGDCQHFWERVIYLKSGGQITVNEARKMILQLPVAQRAAAKWEQNASEVAKAPRDMVNNGFLLPR